MKQFIIVLMFLCILGCSSPTYTEVPEGKIITADVIPTSFNESSKMRIETTTGIFIIYGIISVRKADDVFSRIYSNGKKELCIEGQTYCYRY